MPTLIDAAGARVKFSGRGPYSGIDADGNRFSFGGAQSDAFIKALLVGDSITSQSEVTLSLGSPYAVDNGNGTVTVTRTSHGCGVGQPFRLISPQESTNAMDGIITSVVDANNFIGTIGSRTHAVTSATAGSVILPQRRSVKGWYTWLETLLGEMFDTTWCAVGGARIQNCMTLVEASDSSLHDVAFVCVGMNNIYADGDSLATCKTYMEALLSVVEARSRMVVLLAVPPRNSADANWSAGKQTIHTQFNRWLYEVARTSGYIWINTPRVVANGASYRDASASEPDGTASFMFDNTHPSGVGAYGIGKAVYDAISNRVGVLGGWKPSHPDDLGADAGLVVTDGTFATDAAGVATGWAQSDTTTNSIVGNSCESRTVADHGDAVGRNQVITYRYGTATGTASTRFRKNNIQASLTAGQMLQVRVPFSVASAAGLLAVELAVFGTYTDGTFWQVYGCSQDSNADPFTDTPITGVLQTVPCQIPADLSDVDIWIRPYISSAQASDLTLKVWHPQVRMYEAT